MALFKPFKALRPKPEYAKKISSPPYDVLSREEARELAKDNPISFLHVINTEIDFPDEVDIYDERVYEKAKENLEWLIKEGYLIEEERNCFYLYEEDENGHSQTGIVGLVSVDEYDQGIIRTHESTRRIKVDDRAKHIKTLGAHTEPVFLTYYDTEETEEMYDIFNEIKSKIPLYKFKTGEGVSHTIWRIEENSIINKIQEILRKVPALYIADGHHRSESASIVRREKRVMNPNHTGEEEYNYFLGIVYPHTELRILAYNRVVKDLNFLTKEEFFNKIKKSFIIENVEGRYEPDTYHNFGMYVEGKWYHLKAKEGSFLSDHPYYSLDVSVLQENLLAPILGIKNPKEDERIDFVSGKRGLKELEKLVDSGRFKVAFSMYPTQIEQLMRISDNGEKMPPKSTWFEPKPKSGLFVHRI
ncbi:MAG: DUF1015 family protein [candidate division WOR-3 bacterium]